MRSLLLILILTGLTSLHAADEASPVQVTAELGFSNLFQAGKPLPFQVDVTAVKITVDGKLRIFAHNLAGGVTLYELPISLAPGAHKRWRITLPPISGNNVRVEVADRRGRLVNQQDFTGLSVEAESPLLVVAQDNVSKRFVFPRKSGDPSTGSGHGARGDWHTASVPPDFLPEDPLAYAGVSALFWRSDRAQALNELQAAALLNWLRRGGLLIIAGGRTLPPSLPRDFKWLAHWEDVRPFPISQIADSKLLPPTRPLTMLSKRRDIRWAKGNIPSSTVAIKPLTGEEIQTEIEIGGTRVQALVNKFSTRLQAGADKLMVETVVGGGVLMQLAFDPMDLVEEGFVLGNDFWEQALWLPDPRCTTWFALTWLQQIAVDANHTQLAQIADYRVAPVREISIVFGLFFGLAFCSNFWLFRKSRRYEWAWLILIGASIATFCYNKAYGRVGGFGPTRHVEITQSFGIAGEKTLLTFSEIGLLAPRSRDETFHSLLGSQILFGSDRESRTVQVLPESQVLPVQIKAGAFSTCSSVGFSQLPGEGFSFRWQRTKTEVQVVITNKTGLNLIAPRFSADGIGITMTTEGLDYILRFPLQTFDHWVYRIMITMTDPNKTIMETKQTGEANDEALANFTGCPLKFQFSWPPGAPLATSSGAKNIKQQNEVNLLIPIPVEMPQ